MLSPDIQAEILTLYFTEKRSIRAIALAFGINRRSVQRLVDRRSVQLEKNTSQRASILDPYKEKINELLNKDNAITSTAILNQLRTLGYMGGDWILREYVRGRRELGVKPREAFLRLEFAPGQVAQVDWGEFGDVFGDGVKIHCFAMVLAYSRMIYVEFTRSERFEEFIRCHENALRFFGGAPKECWYDNLTTAVSDRMGSLVRFNARFMAYMGHHFIRPHACNVARGNEKGRVEDLIKYIRMNFWPGREFKDFEDLTKQLIVWRNQTANQREHRSTRRVVRLMFESEEKPALTRLNTVPYETDEIFSRSVSPDFHIQYETNRYSVPWTLVGMTVTVRVNQNEVKIYYNEKFITSHCRSYLKAKVFTKESHRSGLIERKPGANRESWQMSYLYGLGVRMREYIELVKQGPRSVKYEMTRLVGLATVYGESELSEACEECLSRGILGVDSLELYLKRRQKAHAAEKSCGLQPIQFNNEKLNRVHQTVDLRKYDALLFEGSQNLSAAESEKEDGNAIYGTGEPATGIYGTEAEILEGSGD